jgi:glycosyltransferase involved in cell wall biosynthesis
VRWLQLVAKMKVLFAHTYLPGQFVHVASALAADPANEVVYLYDEDQGEPEIPGLRAIRIDTAPGERREAHPFLCRLEEQVLRGLAAYRACAVLRDGGFVPDVMYAHAGSGLGLYLRDAFPEARLLGYFEWFFSGLGSDLDFIDPGAVTAEDLLRRHTTNACALLELVQCHGGVSPTAFQRDQFPPELRTKLTVLHDGVDTAFFDRAGGTGRDGKPIAGLPDEVELVTYAARGLEPYRGFPEFTEAIALLLDRRPRLHVLVAGRDHAYYSRPLPDGRTYRQAALERFPSLDTARVRFLGPLPREQYRALLHASSVHVYLTAPFVLSWSLIEAMAAGCTIVASDTAPVREVLSDGENALLADFHSPSAIAACIDRALDDRAGAKRLATAARLVAEQRFALDRLVPEHLSLLRFLAKPGVQETGSGSSQRR